MMPVDGQSGFDEPKTIKQPNKKPLKKLEKAIKSIQNIEGKITDAINLSDSVPIMKILSDIDAKIIKTIDSYRVADEEVEKELSMLQRQIEPISEEISFLNSKLASKRAVVANTEEEEIERIIKEQAIKSLNEKIKEILKLQRSPVYKDSWEKISQAGEQVHQAMEQARLSKIEIYNHFPKIRELFTKLHVENDAKLGIINYINEVVPQGDIENFIDQLLKFKISKEDQGSRQCEIMVRHFAKVPKEGWGGICGGCQVN